MMYKIWKQKTYIYQLEWCAALCKGIVYNVYPSAFFIVFFTRIYLDKLYYVDMDINAIKVNEVVHMTGAPPC